jgi:hypothetical protein
VYLVDDAVSGSSTAMLPLPCEASEVSPDMAEKSFENDAGVSDADDDGGADDDEGAAVDALGAAVVGVVVLLLLLHAASNNPPATTAAVPMVRLDANCPPLG